LQPVGVASQLGAHAGQLTDDRSDRDSGSAGHIQDRRIELSGATIAYTVAEDSPAPLFVHGPDGSRQTWRHLIGGGIALQMAYQFPERVERLILIGSS